MSKRFGYLLLVLVIILGCAITALYAALQTQYATPIINHLLGGYSKQKIQVEQASYIPPFQLSLQGVTIGNEAPVYLEKAELWFSATLPKAGKWQLDAVVVEGTNLSLTEVNSLSNLPFDSKQLAIKHSDFSWGEFSARSVNVQIEHPNWQANQAIPYGKIQFSSEQLYYQGQAFNDLLVDINYQPENSTLFGASFEWNNAQVSGQAEQYPQGWSLINVTINQLNLSNQQADLTWLSELVKSAPIRDINSLDLLKSNLNYQGIELLNLDLSLENFNLAHSWWQQPNGYLSFNADTLQYQDQQWVEPSATLYLTPNKIEIAELDTDWQQGRVQLQGAFSPNQIELKYLSLSGVKWLDANAEKLARIEQWSHSLEQLSIERLDIRNAQLIQIEQEPFWQASGLNIEGKQLILKQQGEFGLWRGSLQLTANSASYDKFLVTQAIVEMSNHQQIWQLDRLFLPLESGYIEATGQWNKQQLSAPWRLDLTIDGLPLKGEISASPTPIYLKSMTDVNAQLSGLAGDYSMLAHSLSGQVSASIRDGYIAVGEQNKPLQFEQHFTVDDLIINADRGRITLQSPASEQGPQLAGKIDLTKPKLATLLLHFKQKCQQFDADLAAKVYQLNSWCTKSTDSDLNEDEASDKSSNGQQSSLESNISL